MIFMIESQLRYVLDAICALSDPAVASIEVREDALASFADKLARRHQGMVWASGCRSWYLDDDGHNFTLWPGFTFEYRWQTRRFDPAPYRIRPATRPAGAAPRAAADRA